jgi:hypothetical protein
VSKEKLNLTNYGSYNMCRTEIFCKYDDFCHEFEDEWNKILLSANVNSRNRQGNLSLSERMTIITLFHRSNYRTFKHFYNSYVLKHYKKDFPRLISYERFVALIPSMLIPMTLFIYTQRGKCTGISYVDSTKLQVCANIRIPRHKVFKNIAERGKGSMGWFYGFKLHLIVNDKGEILAFHISKGNVDDRAPVEEMSKELVGKLFGDRGYISQKLFERLMGKGLQLITTIKNNMKNKLMNMSDKILLRKRYIIETINDQLKNISQIEHSRHRSLANCMVNILAGLAAYCFQEKKPSIRIYGKALEHIIC